ncbi:Phage tail sheath protein [compost metagenome]
MGSQQPSASVVENTFAVQTTTIDSAIPLFIGYTEVQPETLPIFVTSFSDYEAHFGGPHTGNAVLYFTVKHYFDNGGQSGYIYSLGTYTELDSGVPADIPAALAGTKLAQVIAAEYKITLLAFPDITILSDSETVLWHQSWQIMLSFCRLRAGLFAVLDAPAAPEDAQRCLTHYNGINSEWGGAWWPRLVTLYLKDGTRVMVPPSGAVLAMIQATDISSGIWSAPANKALFQVTRPSHSWLDATELFYSDAASLNLIRSFPGRGTRVWGCRTLTVNSESSFRYVQVRRLVSWCETNISLLGRMFIFEPNNEITWFKFKGVVTNWLRRLWLQGGIYGLQEQEAFQVLLGLNESMTQTDIQAGKMIMNIRLAVISPAEFIELSLVFNMNADISA